MSRREVTTAAAPNWLASPWTPLVAGLALALIAVIVPGEGTSQAPVKGAILVVALVTSGSGVAWRLRTAAWDFDERCTSAGMVAAAGGVPVVALMGLYGESMGEGWDAARLALSTLVGVCLGGAILILLPTLARRIVLSLIILFHLGGVMTAVLSVPPPGTPAPWIVSQMWTRVYRPYLQFMYQNNAYHFYSPEPGPPFQLWCHLKYVDGSTRWVKLPDRRDFPTRQQFQRRLALGQSIESAGGMPVWVETEALRRRTAGITAKPAPIPPHPFLPVAAQYRRLADQNQYLLASYVRYVARNYPSESNPESPVKRLRVYRVIHHWVSAPALAEGVDPADATLMWPYYQGEFDPQGNLQSEPPRYRLDGTLENESTADPFLYWMIPILYTKGGDPRGEPLVARPDRPSPPNKDYAVCDFTEIHANYER